MRAYETFARELEARSRARVTVTRRSVQTSGGDAVRVPSAIESAPSRRSEISVHRRTRTGPSVLL